jgi:transposase
MDRRKASAQVQRLEVVELGRRRRWSAAAKLRIVEESFAGWRQASATARRHGISPSLLFAWRKVYRAGALVDAEPGGLVPAVVVDERPLQRRCQAGSRSSRRMDIAISRIAPTG